MCSHICIDCLKLTFLFAVSNDCYEFVDCTLIVRSHDGADCGFAGADGDKLQSKAIKGLVLLPDLTGFFPEAQDVSCLHALYYLHSNGGLASILGMDGPAHDSELFVGGAHALVDRLGKKYEHKIVLNQQTTYVRTYA